MEEEGRAMTVVLKPGSASRALRTLVPTLPVAYGRGRGVSGVGLSRGRGRTPMRAILVRDMMMGGVFVEFLWSCCGVFVELQVVCGLSAGCVSEASS